MIRPGLYIFIIVILLFSRSCSAQKNQCNYMVWSDEFEYEGAPDPAKWGYDIGGSGWGNNELQTYTNSRNNSYVQNGKLFIHAKKVNNQWTSARLVTKGKGDFLYGRIEISAKLPSGKGTWPAIWMLPTNWEYGNWPNSGEIDIMEHVGYEQNLIHGTVHTGAYNHTLGTQKGGSKYISTASSEFHTYAIEWYEEEILFFIDNTKYFTFKNENKTTQEWPFNKVEHLLLNIAIGGDWGGAQGIDQNLEEAVMEVEYVRVYNNAPAKPIIEGPSLVSSNTAETYNISIVDDYYYHWIVPNDASIIEGQGTGSLSVLFGETSGELQVELQSDCDTISSDLFEINVSTNSQTFSIPNFDAHGNLLWEIETTDNNLLSFEKENDNEVKVVFDVQSPLNNPSIIYHFNSPIDFSSFNRMVFNLKTNREVAPSNLRIDLVDESNNIDFLNLFAIGQINADGDSNLYAHNFNPDSENCDLRKIAHIRILFNYSGYGEKGSGAFVFSPIEMKNYKSSLNENMLSPIKIWPNPVEDVLYIKNEQFSFLKIFNSKGLLIATSTLECQVESTLNFSEFNSGNYFLLFNNETYSKAFKIMKK